MPKRVIRMTSYRVACLKEALSPASLFHASLSTVTLRRDETSVSWCLISFPLVLSLSTAVYYRIPSFSSIIASWRGSPDRFLDTWLRSSYLPVHPSLIPSCDTQRQWTTLSYLRESYLPFSTLPLSLTISCSRPFLVWYMGSRYHPSHPFCKIRGPLSGSPWQYSTNWK